ncbi:hypothetical protein MCOR25_009377 [Pyricularia grisea]|uniref:Cation/H+ exchanger transmembrane domain-containing protein n=1 Tax=Pyricularia grisea TaxID=148305 RepID=A0A6P8BHQ1_PYRGI|nr:uncharacterized protein PgNI_00221 [Pyricularia grisea]KAI6352592.1 hypothetical protein MCOR25_009377 [Pyricularia grisea]TLD16172.1 hypothetical protein PgNI_00221 [Pyricularia grisea]
MPTLAITNFNIVLTVLGAWITLFGLVSYVSKDRLYLSDPLISLLVGVALSPLAANLIRPLEYVGGSEVTLDEVTLGFSRLVLGVQLVMAGVHLPSRYLRRQWRPLTILVGPVMAGMWLMTSLLVWGLVVVPFRGSTVDGTGVLWALAIGACVTPTDPVLSGVIVKGRFADDNVPQELQRLIIAESGANDGLGYPFLFLPLFLLKYVAAGGGNNQSPVQGGASTAMGMWFGETWGYVVILGAVYGAVAGWVAKELLHWADRRKFVDRESFLVSSIAMALFIVGTGGMLGSDDVLACFVAGNVFTWDDWFRLETLDDMLEPTVDMLLNVTIFMWYGAICPWNSFLHNDVVPIWRLVLLGILVLALRRLPFVLAAHRFIPQISGDHNGNNNSGLRQALFVGFFGPIGVSAIFYLQVALEFVAALGEMGLGDDSSIKGLTEMLRVVVWFIAVCSIVVHGLSIPFGKIFFRFPHQFLGTTWGQALSRSSTVAILNPAQGLPITAPPTTGPPSYGGVSRPGPSGPGISFEESGRRPSA